MLLNGGIAPEQFFVRYKGEFTNFLNQMKIGRAQPHPYRKFPIISDLLKQKFGGQKYL